MSAVSGFLILCAVGPCVCDGQGADFTSLFRFSDTGIIDTVRAKASQSLGR